MVFDDWHSAGSVDVLRQFSEQQSLSFHWLIAGLLTLMGAIGFGTFKRYGTSLTLAIAASVLVGWHVRTEFLPKATWMQPTVTARAVLAEICGLQPDRAPSLYLKTCHAPFPEHVQAVGYAEPSLVFTTGTNTVIPPQTVVALPDAETDYPIVYLLNIEDGAGVAAQEKLARLARMQGRQVSQSAPRYALNYSNGDPVAFIAMRID